MNCPRCNYPINKDNVWSNCPKCNCLLYRETPPVQRVKVSQPYKSKPSVTQESNSTRNNNKEASYQTQKVKEQSPPRVSYCMQCGQKIEAGQKYCFRCGSATFVPNNSKPYSKEHKKAINKKLLIPLCSGVLLLVLIITVVLLLNNKPQETKLDQSSNSNAEILTPTETTTDVNFDLNAYDDHGNLSCGLVWASQNNWNDEMDEYQKEFAYFDASGNQKSVWFSYDNYKPANFKNGFIVLTEKNGEGIKRKLRLNNTIYDSEFNLIGNIITEDPDGTNRTLITSFDENGFAFAYGTIQVGEDSVYGSFWVDKNGIHPFDDDVPYISDMSDIEVTDKYFILDNLCICDHQGQIVLNIYNILRDNEELNKKYTVDDMNKNRVGERHDTLINILEISENKYVSLEFNAENKQSKNTVWFTCKIDFSGNIIDGPNKKNP